MLFKKNGNILILITDFAAPKHQPVSYEEEFD